MVVITVKLVECEIQGKITIARRKITHCIKEIAETQNAVGGHKRTSCDVRASKFIKIEKG